MAASAQNLRSLYRRFLREMPTRTPSLLANPSPLQKHIRTDIATSSSPNSPSLAQQLQTKSAEARAQEAEQYLQFVQERVRLTAKRVGMELPIEAMMGGKKE